MDTVKRNISPDEGGKFICAVIGILGKEAKIDTCNDEAVKQEKKREFTDPATLLIVCTDHLPCSQYHLFGIILKVKGGTNHSGSAGKSSNKGVELQPATM